MGLERTPSGRQSDAGCEGVGATCMQPSKAACITRESNTGHIVGNAGYYHETTGAPEGRVSLRRVAHLTRRAGSAKSGRSARSANPRGHPSKSLRIRNVAQTRCALRRYHIVAEYPRVLLITPRFRASKQRPARQVAYNDIVA